MFTRYAFNSLDRRFPGTLEDQQAQYPDTVWLDKPRENGTGGHVMGVRKNGDEIHAYDGLLVTVFKSAISMEALTLENDRKRLARRRAQIGQRSNPAPVTEMDRRLAQVRARYKHMNTREFVAGCANGTVDMGKFAAILRPMAQKLVDQRNHSPGYSARMTGDRDEL